MFIIGCQKCLLVHYQHISQYLIVIMYGMRVWNNVLILYHGDLYHLKVFQKQNWQHIFLLYL
jgi:hypothetical protein